MKEISVSGRFIKGKRLILIDRSFQLRYAGIAVILGLSTTLLTGLLILYPLYVFEILRIPHFVPWPIMLVAIAAAILNILMIGIAGVLASHRIAGPIFSLVRSFRAVEDGCWGGTLEIRDGDDLGYVVRKFNAMVSGMRQQVNGDAATLAEIAAKLGESAALDAQESSARILDVIQVMKQRLVKIASYKKGFTHKESNG